MSNDFRTVIDTGVIVSAVLLAESVPRKAIDAALRTGHLLASEATLAELDEVLRRPRFNRYISEERRLEFLTALVREAEIVEITEKITVCRDPNDDKFLEAAVNGRASHILSSDLDLLAIHPFRGIPILTPRAFVNMLSAKDHE
jgi:putative PIN family toxin of toxin-antitoxin system